jgi:hypothetical protein
MQTKSDWKFMKYIRFCLHSKRYFLGEERSDLKEDGSIYMFENSKEQFLWQYSLSVEKLGAHFLCGNICAF